MEKLKTRTLRSKEGQITQSFIQHCMKKNNGLGWALGTDLVRWYCQTDKITAHSDGVVIWAGSDPTVAGYGNFVMIEHENKYVTLYAHLECALCFEGEEIHTGDIIGMMGSTGNSFGAHVHFEVRKYSDLKRGSFHDVSKFVWLNSELYLDADFNPVKYYRVQIGAFQVKLFACMRAQALQNKLAGTEYAMKPIIKFYNNYYHVQVGAFNSREAAVNFGAIIEDITGFDTFITCDDGEEVIW